MRIGDVGSDDPEFAAVLFAQCVDALLRGIAWRASAGQHQVLGAVRGQVSGDLQPDGSEATSHQIRCVTAQFERRGARLVSPPDQPGNVDRLFAQRDLVFPGGRLARRRHHLADELRPFVGDCSLAVGRQVGQSAPHLRKLQSGGATESPQATLVR